MIVSSNRPHAVMSWQQKVLCRYFMVGACQKGSSCPYSHDKNISNKGTLPCRFYQAGTCANGTNCRLVEMLSGFWPPSGMEWSRDSQYPAGSVTARQTPSSPSHFRWSLSPSTRARPALRDPTTPASAPSRTATTTCWWRTPATWTLQLLHSTLHHLTGSPV